MYTLDRLPLGREAVITAVDTRGALRRRLMDLGFLPGSTVCRLCRAGFGGPDAYSIRGTVIALRQEDGALLRAKLPDGSAS